MGSDPAPFFANMFLYFYEGKWIKDLQKKDLIKARKPCNAFRFIDDMIRMQSMITSVVLESTNTQFVKEHSTIWPVWENN